MPIFLGNTCNALDTLRISKRQWDELISQINTYATSAYAKRKARDSNMRTAPRHPYSPIKGLGIQVVHPGGSKCYYLAKPWNLSTTGISFLHGAYLYPGTKIVSRLITLDDRSVQITGKVVRCRHVSGKAHEVGVHLDLRIDPFDYIALEAHPTAEPSTQ